MSELYKCVITANKAIGKNFEGFVVSVHKNEHINDEIKIDVINVPSSYMAEEEFIKKVMKEYGGERQLTSEWVLNIDAVIEIREKVDEALEWLDSISLMAKLNNGYFKIESVISTW